MASNSKRTVMTLPASAKGHHHQHITADNDWDDDFESALVLPEGPLSLSLSSRRGLGSSTSSSSSNKNKIHHQRPQTALSNASASSTSGGSSIFSSNSSLDSASDNDNDEDDLNSNSNSNNTNTNGGGPARASLWQHDESADDAYQLNMEVATTGDDSEEKSSTIKANQLPPDFAEQLALSKVKATDARETEPRSENKTTASTTMPIAPGSSSSTATSSLDWSGEFVFNDPKQDLQISRLLRNKASFAPPSNPSQVDANPKNLSVRLRPRPSLSNISVSAAASRPNILARKKSMPALANIAHRPPSVSPVSPVPSSATSVRSQTSTAHYAQPTRSFLARQQQIPLASALPSVYHAESGSRSSSPAIVLTRRSDTPSSLSPSTSTSSISRLLQPTIASRAKLRHVPSASDPSGRTSASLGTPLVAGLASLPSSPSVKRGLSSVASGNGGPAPNLENRFIRRPSQLRTFGDGSELDNFDDLPVNKEMERSFVKAPRKRQSSGATSNGSNASALQARRALPVAPRPQDSIFQKPRCLDSNSRDNRNAHDQQDNSSSRVKRSDSTSTAASTATARQGQAGSNLTIPTGKAKQRPALKLIRKLSATGLSQDQGQMKWNPTSMTWEGNESSLRGFDNVMSSSARPALISPIFGPLSPRVAPIRSPLGIELPMNGSNSPSTNIASAQRALGISNPHGTTPSLGGVRVVGDMIFDPVKMRWFNTAADGEEELNFGDDENEEMDISSSGTKKGGEGFVDAWEGGEQMRLRTRRSFANDWSSNASSQGDVPDDDWSFEDFKQLQLNAEKRHIKEMQDWVSEARAATGPSYRQAHLHDIRQLVDA